MPIPPATSAAAAHDASGPPWREPARGGYPDATVFRLSGFEQLREMLAGNSPQPPISRLTGNRLTDIGADTATFEMPLTDWLCAPQGAISIGPLVIPADAAMACAIMVALPPATPFTTSELSLRLLAPARPRTEIRARGRLIQLRRTIGLAEVAVTDKSDDRLIAHGSTLCVLLPSTAPPETPEAPARQPPPQDGSPDPWQRPALGEVLDQSIWERMSGLEVLRAQLAGTLPWAPIQQLTGLRLIAADEHEVSFEMPATEWFCAPARGRVQGGAIALLAETALSAAIQARLPAGTALAPIDLKLNYLRPLAADGRPATAYGRVLHAGRRVAIANAEVRDADGKPVALATGSALTLAGRPASPATDGARLRADEED